MFNHHPPYSPDIAPSDFRLFLHLKKFLSGQRERSQNNRETEMRVEGIPIQAADFEDTGYKSWSYSMANASIPEMNMLKNGLTLAVYGPINLSIKLENDLNFLVP